MSKDHYFCLVGPKLKAIFTPKVQGLGNGLLPSFNEGVYIRASKYNSCIIGKSLDVGWPRIESI